MLWLQCNIEADTALCFLVDARLFGKCEIFLRPESSADKEHNKEADIGSGNRRRANPRNAIFFDKNCQRKRELLAKPLQYHSTNI